MIVEKNSKFNPRLKGQNYPQTCPPIFMEDYADPSSLWRASPRQVTQISKAHSSKLKAQRGPRIT